MIMQQMWLRRQRRYSQGGLRIFPATLHICDQPASTVAYRDTSQSCVVTVSGTFVLMANVIYLLPETTATSFMTLVLIEVYKPRITATITHRLVPTQLGIHKDLPVIVRHHHILADLHLAAAYVESDLKPIGKTDRCGSWRSNC